MATTPIRIAIIGAGLIGPRHAQTVHDSLDAIVVAVVDPAPSGMALAKNCGASYFTSIEALLTSPEPNPDGAIICTPNHMHVPLGLKLIDAGIHLLMEKPISTDIESGKILVEAAQQEGVKILVGHHRRFNSYVITAKEIIQSGKIGEVVAVNGLWTMCKPDSYFRSGGEWRQSNSSGGGVILINMIHEVDILQYLLGPIVRVYADRLPTKRGFQAEEGAAINFRFASGAVGTFLLGDNIPSPHCFESGTGENPMIPYTGKDFYRIFGSEGTLSVPEMMKWSYAGSLKSWTEPLQTDRVPVHESVPFRSQFKHFMAVIMGHDEPSCSGREALAALLVCDAVKQSLETNLPVDIDLQSV